MMAPGAYTLMLLLYLAPFVFLIWAIVSAVSALKRIASALENGSFNGAMAGGQNGVQAQPPVAEQRVKEARDPAYKYMPKK